VRILLINAFHYPRGGVERIYFDESRWLAGAGHDVLHFAIRDPRNLPSPTAGYFAPPADYGEGGDPWRQLGQLGRVVWSKPAEDAMARLVADQRPDVAHVHAPSRYLTPSILRPLARAGVPVVMTLHDFKPWCTNRVMFARGAPCERCKGGRHWHALAVGCVQDSHARSAVAMAEAYAHDLAHAYGPVRLWIAPSRFVAAKVAEHGLDPARVRLLPHGLESNVAESRAADDGRYTLYAGRLSVEKGVRILPALAMRLSPRPVWVAGEGPLGEWLGDQAGSLPNLKRLGRLEGAEFARTLRAAGVVVVPSLSYETFCFAAAEALAAGRPVVASQIGAIPELIEHERTGLLVPPGDAHALAEAVERTLDDDAAAQRWAAAGRAHVAALAAPGTHLAGLLAIYEEARGAR